MKLREIILCAQLTELYGDFLYPFSQYNMILTHKDSNL